MLTPANRPGIIPDIKATPASSKKRVSFGDAQKCEDAFKSSQKPEQKKKPFCRFIDRLRTLRTKLSGKEVAVDKGDEKATVSKANEAATVRDLPISAEDIKKYGDTKVFAQNFENKIKGILGDLSEEEISEKISNAAKITGESEEKAAEVMTRLNRFASWSQMSAMEKEFEKLGISGISRIFLNTKHVIREAYSFYPPMTSMLTINDVMEYACGNKNQAQFADKGVNALFIDDAQLELIEDAKENYPEKYEELCDKIEKGDVRLIIIDGWNAKYKGQNVAQTMFGSAVDTEDACIAILKKMQEENITLDEALNGETVSRIKSIFGEDTPVEILKNNDIKEYGAKETARITKSKYPDAEQIETVIDTIIENEVPSCYNSQKARILLSKYFDEMLVCHSARTLDKTYKEMHEKITDAVKSFGKTEEDTIYIIPDPGKSYDLAAYQYSKVNNIPQDKFIYYSGKGPVPKDFHGNKVNLNDKVVVILDDIVGTGYSMCYNRFFYDEFAARFSNTCDVIMATTTTSESGLQFIEDTLDNVHIAFKEGRKKDIFIPGQLIDFEKFLNDSGISKTKNRFLNKELNLFMKIIGGFGYQKTASCTAFPYMLPDNNSPASGFLLSSFLSRNTPNSNKKIEFYEKYTDDVNQAAAEKRE